VTLVITSAGDLTRDWLSQALGTEVRSVTLDPIGTGQSASTYRLRIDADNCPATLIAKFAKGSEDARRRLATAHRNEVGFYRVLAETLDIRVPACHYAAISPDATSFTLLLEDLSPRLPGRQADGCSFEHAAESVRNLARLHASRWNDEALRDVDFLVALTEERAAFLADLAHTATDQFIARYSHQLSADDVTTLRDVAAALLEWQLAHPEPFSLIHGDYRLDNLMLHPTRDDVVAVDWQTVTVALPARDLGYFIGTSLPTGQRRAEEERLLVTYYEELQSCGVRAYSSARCLADYRLGQLHGPMITVIGSLTSTGWRDHDGDEMFLSMAQRSCTAVRDHQSINAL
jgi:aminoglycoside/choline kinase family phosphotransferase